MEGAQAKTESDIIDLSDDTLDHEFQKLSAAEKIKYNQFYLFHYQQQQQEKLSGMMHHKVQCQIRSKMIPKLPEPVAVEEMKWAEVEEDQVQVEEVVDAEDNEVRRIIPIFVKEEPDCKHTVHEPAHLPPGMPELPTDATVSTLLNDEELQFYNKEATDSEECLPDDAVLPEEAESSAAESMEDDIMQVDAGAFDAALNEIFTGLEMAALGYTNLWALLPQLPVHEVPKVLESTPPVYTDPMPHPLIEALRDIGPEKVLDHIIAGESKTTSSHQICLKYRLTRARTGRVLMGTMSKGSNFYSKLKKEGGKTTASSKAPKVKKEVKMEHSDNCIEVSSG